MGGAQLGINFLNGERGFTIDNILEYTLVKPDGTVVIANKDKHTEIFWGLRGSKGGNFGVITNYKLRVFPDNGVYTYGYGFVSPTQYGDIMNTYQAIASNPNIPKHITSLITMQTVQPFGFVLVYGILCNSTLDKCQPGVDIMIDLFNSAGYVYFPLFDPNPLFTPFYVSWLNVFSGCDPTSVQSQPNGRLNCNDQYSIPGLYYFEVPTFFF